MKLIQSKTAMLMGAAAFIGLISFAGDAFAATATVNSVVTNLITGTSGVVKMVNFVAYMLAIMFTIYALFALKRHIENPGQNPFTKVLASGLTAAFLGVLPVIIGAVIGTAGTAGSGATRIDTGKIEAFTAD